MSALEGAILYEELGRSLAPTPHFVSAVMSAGVLLRAGTDEQRQSLLPRIATGEIVMTTAWIEPHHGFGPEGDHADARRPTVTTSCSTARSGTCRSRRRPTASSCSPGPMPASTCSRVDAKADGITTSQQLTIAADAQFEVAFDGVRVSAASRIGAPDDGFHTLLPYGVAGAADGVVYAGLQDNGEIRIEPDGRQSAIFGGDGIFTLVDPANSDIAYDELPEAGINVTTDGGVTWTDIDPLLDNASFYAPIVMDPADSNHIVVGGREIAETLVGTGDDDPRRRPDRLLEGLALRLRPRHEGTDRGREPGLGAWRPRRRRLRRLLRRLRRGPRQG